MEFKTLRNIENSFKQIRLFTMIFAVLCFAVVSVVVFKSYTFAEAQRQKIYVLDNGKSLMVALSQDMSINRPVEAREHVRRFHELFFTVAPDKNAIESNVKRAFYLADESAFNYYKDLSEKGYYNRIISGNIQQRIEVDSVVANFDSYPYQVKTFAKQYITRSSNLTTRSLITNCSLVNSVRSDNNPQGFTIEKFNVAENKDVETVNR
ncbi:conjugative transposon protein TraK [Chryseobacterium sp. RLHN22]|uniref:conjugative transposon protein TraK n=1 Tax=Chryseobacterium sp. RLHN22 TaxID=3437885 RepID=UPI003D9BEF5B